MVTVYPLRDLPGLRVDELAPGLSIGNFCDWLPVRLVHRCLVRRARRTQSNGAGALESFIRNLHARTLLHTPRDYDCAVRTETVANLRGVTCRSAIILEAGDRLVPTSNGQELEEGMLEVTLDILDEPDLSSWRSGRMPSPTDVERCWSAESRAVS